MALDNYDNLQKEIIDWSHRKDLGVKIPDFIQITENLMYSNDVQPLMIRAMEFVSTALTSGQYLALPDDFEKARSVRLVVDGNGEIEFQSPEQMYKRSGTGRPLFYTVVGNEFQFDITPDSEYTIEVQYFRKAAALSNANQTNEVLTDHPSIYLYGSLAQLFAYAQDEQQQAKYFSLFIAAIRGANKADKKGRYGPAPSMSIDNLDIV